MSDGHLLEGLALEAVAGADRDLVELVEDVELRDRERVEAVDAHGVAHRDRVEPAAAPRPAGGRAVLAAALAQIARPRAPSSRVGNGPVPTRVQ